LVEPTDRGERLSLIEVVRARQIELLITAQKRASDP
jgi:hypothetical protein